MLRRILFFTVLMCVQHTHSMSVQDLIDQGNAPVVWHGGLNLSHKGLTDLDGLQNIPNLEKVRLLSIRGNAIRSIPREAFKGLKNLLGLDASYNGIERIEPGAFVGLKRLKALLLNGNNIEEIPEKGFKGISRLRLLTVYRNPISTEDVRELHKHVPRAFIFNGPITKEYLKKAGIAAAIIAVAIGAVVLGVKYGREGSEGERRKLPADQQRVIDQFINVLYAGPSENISLGEHIENARQAALGELGELQQNQDVTLAKAQLSEYYQQALREKTKRDLIDMVDACNVEGLEDALSVEGASDLLGEIVADEKEGSTLLHIAFFAGCDNNKDRRIDMFDLILRKKPELAEIPNKAGVYPIHLAAHMTPYLIPLLTRHGADVDVRQPGAGQAPLHQIIGKREFALEAVKNLLASGADVNARDNDGNTVLHIAAADVAADSRNEWIVRMLLKQPGIKLNIRNKSGQTPLDVANGNTSAKGIAGLLERAETR